MTATLPNQARRLPEHDAWEHDVSLRWWVEHNARGVAEADSPTDAGLHEVGRSVGGWQLQDAADRANVQVPRLRTFDRVGNRIDQVQFDASWHELLGAVLDSGVTGMPWALPRGGYVARAAAAEQWSRLDLGIMCPISMTTAAVPVLHATRGLDDPWARMLAHGDPRQAVAGMAMTEPQGGSDLAGSGTLAQEKPDGSFRLSGHKWFCSHPVADVLLVLAREPGLPDGSRGLSCFLVPGWLPDGSRNHVELQRLKDKLGTRSLASAEVLLRDAHAQRVGDPGAGVRTIIDMVTHTRMDCSLGSTGLLTRAVMEAVNHARGRRAFGAALIDQPLMRMVLADLALEREASLALSMEVARLFDGRDPLQRLVPAIAKYWITRRAVQAAVEVVEVLGGNGYTEEFVPARLYRDAQVNSTWEGSGNVIVLDVFRALERSPELAHALRDRVQALLEHADAATAEQVVARVVPAAGLQERDGRRYVGGLAVALQAALLAHRAATSGGDDDLAVARAFAGTRLTHAGERLWGDGGAQLAEAAQVLLPRYSVDG